MLRPGTYLLAGILGLGLATLNTGNNLLYLLLGALLGLIVLSGWLSEKVLRGVDVKRRLPRAVTAGAPCAIEYVLRRDANAGEAYALEVGEAGWPASAVIAVLEPGSAGVVRVDGRFPRRGIIELDAVRLATAFPFGLFRKARNIEAAGRLIVWPRTDRKVHLPGRGGERRVERAGAARATAARADFHALRPYRPGDDPRDVHWRASARAGEPIVREYEHAEAQILWICLDTRGTQGGVAEEQAVEIAAALAADALRRGEPVGFSAAGELLAPAAGRVQLERILDALAAVRFEPAATQPLPPAGPAACVLVTASSRPTGGFRDVFAPEAA